MEDQRTVLEKILAGYANVKDYDFMSDFDFSEIRTLLDEHIIETRDIPEALASDMIIEGYMEYDEYPFENLSPYEQIRQLEQKIIPFEEFKSKVNLEDFNEEDKRFLHEVCPEFDEKNGQDELSNRL